MRRIFQIPIIHTAADLGSLADSVQREYARILGPNAWNQRQEAVVELWSHIRTKIEALHLDYRKTKLYQDGLPVCDFERQIVEELAEAGSVNHQFILDLLARGALLMGTEDSQLLVQEYQLQRRLAEDPSAKALQVEAQRLLQARDHFIVQRINETLQPGEVGLLFLGAAHKLESLPSDDIRWEMIF
jgi:hypothetical protein